MSAETRAKSCGKLAAEIFGSLLLVLALFSLFLGLLYALFPSGTPLKELVEGTAEQGPGRFAGGRQMEATLSSLEHDVRYRRGNSIAWGGASEGMPLYSQDAVQTLDHSTAGISFSGKDRLVMGSNTLIVVTRLKREDEGGAKSYRVQVEGEVRGSLSAGRKVGIEVAAGGHVARIAPGAARFRLLKNGRDSESLAVYAGELQVLDNGRVIRVRADHGVTLRKGAAVGPAVPLPAAPALSAERARYRYRLLPPRVSFNWQGPPGEYHFQLSSDPSFSKCLIDQKIASGRESGQVKVRGERGTPVKAESHEFTTGKLSHGSYYWRVSRIDEGREGAFSRTAECQLDQQLDSPALSVNFPPEKAPAGPYLLTGTAPPGSRVFIEGVEVAGSEGGFRHEIRLKPGVNLVRVEALDEAGNASYASRIVYGQQALNEAAR